MQEPKHIKHKNKRDLACPSAPKHSEQLLGTYGNLLNLKKHEIFDLKKTSYGKKEEEDRRRKKDIDSPQTFEANNKHMCFKSSTITAIFRYE